MTGNSNDDLTNAEKRFMEIVSRRIMNREKRSIFERNMQVKHARFLRFATVTNLYRQRKITKSQAIDVLKGPLTYDSKGKPAMYQDDSKFMDMDFEAVEKEIYGYNILDKRGSR